MTSRAHPGCRRVIRMLRGQYTCVIRCRHDSVATPAAPVCQQWPRAGAYARHASDRVVLSRDPCLGTGSASASFSQCVKIHISIRHHALTMPRKSSWHRGSTYESDDYTAMACSSVYCAEWVLQGRAGCHSHHAEGESRAG